MTAAAVIGGIVAFPQAPTFWVLHAPAGAGNGTVAIVFMGVVVVLILAPYWIADRRNKRRHRE
jgi:hypothetical protein